MTRASKDIMVEPPAPDLIPVDMLEQGRSWEPYIFWGLGVLLLLSILVLLRRVARRRDRGQNEISAADRAVAGFLLASEQEDGASMASQASLSLRQYLYEVFGETSLYETGGEWALRDDFMSMVRTELASETRDLLRVLDRYCYQPRESVERDLQDAVKALPSLIRKLEIAAGTTDGGRGKVNGGRNEVKRAFIRR